MARARSPTLFLVMAALAAGAQAGEPLKAPWSGIEKPPETSNFSMPHAAPAPTAEMNGGSRIFAGTALLPNTMFGLGLFGERVSGEPLAPVTGREIDLPKRRKAAVGFSLRF